MSRKQEFRAQAFLGSAPPTLLPKCTSLQTRRLTCKTFEVVHSETFDMRSDETFDMRGETFDMHLFERTHVKRLGNVDRCALDCG